MSIYKRSTNSWSIQIDLGRDPFTGKRRRRTFSVRGSKRDAQAAERQALTERDRGIDIEPSRITVAQYLDRWLDNYAVVNVRPITLARYRSLVKRLKTLLGEVSLQKLRPDRVQASYSVLLRDGLSAGTVLAYHRLLHQALSHAVGLQLIPTNPAAAVKPPRARPAEKRALTPAEVEVLLASIQDDEMRRIAHVAVTTGARLSEVVALTWKSVDLEGRQMAITRAAHYLPGKGVSFEEPKSAAGRRTIALARSTIATLQEQKRAQAEQRLRIGPSWSDRDLVFPDQLGEVRRPYAVSARFARLATVAEFDDITFHNLRHTHATVLLRGGVNVKLVAARLGHANAAVTLQTYQHMQPDLAEHVADVVDDLLA